MIKSIFYTVMLLLFFICALLWKRKETKINIIENIAIAIMTILCWNAFATGIIQLFSIKISLIAIGLTYFIPILYILFTIKKKGIQHNNYSLWDIVPIVIGGILLFHYIKNYFGLDLQLHFIASDAARHLDFALTTVNSGDIALNMYFHSLNDSLAMLFFNPFISTVMGQAKVFTLMSLFDLVLFGLVFYAIIRPLMKSTLDYIIGNILLFMYVCGYPLYVMQFGFSYYVSAIILIEFIILIATRYLNDSSLSWLILLNLALYSLFVCYTFLIPVTYLSLFIAVLWKRFKPTSKVLLKTALEEIKIFIIPCILGLYYSYKNLSELSSSGGGITNEGGSYFDLFSNFIWLLPIAFVGLTVCFKKIKHYVLSSFIITNVLFTLLIFILCMKGKMSAYYYYKEYNVLWLLAFLAFFYGVLELEKHRLDLICISIAIPIALISMVVFRIEDRITEHNPNIMNISAKNFVNIYAFNYNYYKNFPMFNPLYIDLMNYANENISDSKKIAVGDEVTNAWFQTLTNSKKSFAYGTHEDLVKFISEENPDYICIFASERYNENKEYLDSLGECIYKNEGGFIIKIK